MKAKYVKKLRKEINEYHPFVIHTALMSFGPPYSCEKEPVIYARAGEGVHAVERYCRWYMRKYKMFHPNWSRNFHTTTVSNGYFEVVDMETGFKHYVW